MTTAASSSVLLPERPWVFFLRSCYSATQPSHSVHPPAASLKLDSRFSSVHRTGWTQEPCITRTSQADHIKATVKSRTSSESRQSALLSSHSLISSVSRLMVGKGSPVAVPFHCAWSAAFQYNPGLPGTRSPCSWPCFLRFLSLESLQIPITLVHLLLS